jgi:hypothetical protein
MKNMGLFEPAWQGKNIKKAVNKHFVKLEINAVRRRISVGMKAIAKREDLWLT